MGGINKMNDQSILNSVKINCTWGTTNQKAMDRMKDMDAWTVKLQFEKRQMTIPFFMGYGHNGKEPNLKTVLHSLVTDYHAGKESFNDFCGNFGYDEDSRNAERTWNACKAIALKMENLFGEKLEKIELAVEDY
jgi:hypothetical protein